MFFNSNVVCFLALIILISEFSVRTVKNFSLPGRFSFSIENDTSGLFALVRDQRLAAAPTLCD